MPTTYEDIKKTSVLRNKFGRRKVGLYEESARFSTGSVKRRSSVAIKKFSKSNARRKFIFKMNGEVSTGAKDDNKE